MRIKSEFIECLTHDSYVVQIPQIEGRTRTRLEKMLSVFEQKYFIDDRGTRKEYRHDVDDENIRYILEILYHTGADPETQREMETEWWSSELWEEVIVKRDQKIALQKQALEANRKEMEANKKALKESKKALTAKDKALEANKNALEVKDKENEKLRKQLAELQKMVK